MSIEIPSKDKSYEWFLKWMSKHVKETQHLSVMTSFEKHENGNIKTNFDFLPSVGNHFLNFRNTWIRVERVREKSTIDLRSGNMWETVTLTMLGRDKSILLDLLLEAKNMALKEEEGVTIIYTCFGHEWRPFGTPRRRRPLSSVILNGDISNSILEDVKEFLNNPSWYTQRGIPYRRGYLLYGPPGSGILSHLTHFHFYLLIFLYARKVFFHTSSFRRVGV